MLAVLLSGCATNLSSLQTARTMYQGQVRVQGGVGAYVPVGAAANVIGEGVQVAKEGITAAARQEQFVLSEDRKQGLLTSGLALATMPPSTVWELSARVGIFDFLEAGLRYSVNQVRLDVKWRFAHLGDPDTRASPARRSIDFAVGVAVSRHLFQSPVVEALEFVKLGDFERWDFEFPLYASVDFNPYFGLYASPKYIYGVTTMDEKLVEIGDTVNSIVDGQCCGDVIALDTRIPARVDTHFVGATLGLRAGHPRVYGFLELTLGNTWADAQILGQRRQLGGFTVQPNLGLAVTIN